MPKKKSLSHAKLQGEKIYRVEVGVIQQTSMEVVNFYKLANFTPKQKLFLELVKNYRYVLLSGAVGTGKSRALRWTLLYLLLKHAKKYPNLLAGLFCRTYPELNDRHLKYVKFEFPEWLGVYYEQKHEFVLYPEYGGGIIAFRNLDEPEKYRSSEFAFIAVDELTQIPKETFDILLERNRWPNFNDVKFIAATNAVGEHRIWVREFFIEKTSSDRRCEESAVLYLKPGDNPYLPKDYYEKLAQGMDENLRRALLENDWYALDDVIDEKGYSQLISYSQLQNAFSDIENYKFLNASVLGIDVGGGGDETVIVIRDSFMAQILFNKKLSDTMQILPLISQFLKLYNIQGIAIDATGIGWGIYNRLMEIQPIQNIVGVKGGERAEDSSQFFNKKAELYWKAREWILKGGKLKRDKGWEELLTIKYKIQSDRTIKLQPKDELLRQGIKSPNIADAFAFTFCFDIESLEQYQKMAEFEEIFYNLE